MTTIGRALSVVLALAVSLPAVWAGERVVFEKRSDYHMVRVVDDDEGLRALYFGDGRARQTVVRPSDPDHLEADYARAVPLAFAFSPQARRLLVVGLGGGAVPSFLHRKLPALEIDAVELDPVVIEVARSHFGFRDDATLRAIAGDGRAYIERIGRSYDVILLDAFGAEETPESLSTVEFLGAVRRAVAPEGVVISNVWGREHGPAYDSLVRTHREVFKNLQVLDLGSAPNKLLIARPWRSNPDRREIVRRARKLARTLALRFDLAAIAEAGLRAPGRDGERGRVLRDAPTGR